MCTPPADTTSNASNPLLETWDTLHGIPPFASINAAHFEPAFTLALAQHRAELAVISASTSPADFDNTIAAFDKSGRLLKRIEMLFSNLTASETSPALQNAERKLAAPLAAHDNAIYTDARLFARIDQLYQRRGSLQLNAEQLRLLERIHLDFVRAGAKLDDKAKRRYGEIMEQLATLNTRFSQNTLADEAEFQLILKSADELAGLPPFVLAASKQAALERGIQDAHLITLSRSHITPFLTFSSRRDLREQAFKAWLTRGEFHQGDPARDNKLVAVEVMKLRLEQARLHGYQNYADYALADTMAGTPQAVLDLLTDVWQRASARARIEAQDLQDTAHAHGDDITIQPWDWFYYAEKVRKARFDFDEASVKPYFSLERITEAAFDCAHRLFGVNFKELPDAVSYHPDVKTYEVTNASGKLVAIFLHDNFARATKRGGAWMNSYRIQSRTGDGGCAVVPIVVNNNNFAKGAPGEPTLLSYDDARTLFHEFGHGLHGMMSNVHYERLSGTSVLRDFVELPSQLFEHWLSEPEVLKKHARHYLTNEVIPDSLVNKMKQARTFNQGFDAATFCASALVDVQLHLREDMDNLDLAAFEREQLAAINLPPQIYMRHRLPHFLHLFASAGYASQYYVYLWAEVLDADAYDAFKEAGNPFDQATAERLLKFIYSSGGTMMPMAAYEKFRGRQPTVEPMLRKKGLVEA
ncbi:MAG: M3 family metallopeptidase [Burkholderiales bacterium]|nr:M3 family metallopeptidase [Rhodocyclaceae bacterium]MCA3020558.1 M3 family metallopeptidase [Rhodocyclaceae bacterium]MCA3053049.1 M3 family metallopeptidase [Rhodocyclaceae bacterium]